MTSPTPALRRRGLGALLVPFVVALGALPLMAPTCGSPGEGYKVFSRQSLIIPMDVCYQYQTDAYGSSYTPAATCPQATDPGSVIKAYGLVYQLVRAGVPVYWIIDPGKGQVGSANYGVTGIDLTISYSNGAPALLYNWSTGAPGAAATAQPSVNYRGGPFVVDGSDYARASAVLQQFASTFSSVNVHVANVSFRGYAKRTMAGGWSAGGAVPPKLALLDIGSSGAGSKNSEYVIQGYLAQAGLDTTNAGGTTAGPHGQIYDHLYMPDFIPSVAGDWTTTALYRNGYQILWVPHWAAPSSCSDCAPGPSCTCSNKYDAATIATALKTIGAFSAAGGDVFAECAGLGSFEGVFSSSPPSTSGYSSTYGSGGTNTQFQTTSPTGVWINKSVGAVKLDGSFDSPFMQIGDWPFKAASGAIQNYKPAAYKNSPPEVTTKLISDSSDSTYDIFTLIPRTASHGTVVYLGGHSYSGNDGSFEVAGTRLVLNTLFNLGATCTATGLPCNTGLLGVCAQGAWSCDSNGMPYCRQTVFPSPEICDGLDNNCNGTVDEGLTTNCYAPPPGYVDPLGRTGAAFTATQSVGVCQPGVSSCVRNPDGSYGMSACVGQVLPSPESCNGLDDDCDGAVDDGLTQSCYDGPQYTLDANGNPMGICKPGTQTCQNGSWGAVVGGTFTPGVCAGEVLPQAETCANDAGGGTALDLNCDGQLLTGCTCTNGAVRSCFDGPGTPGVGICRAGTQTCSSGTWGECTGETVAILYAPEPCTTPAKPSPDPGYVASDDWNCDGKTAQCQECTAGQSQSCYPDPTNPSTTSPPSIAGRGQCTWGTRTCSNGSWGPCQGYGLPSTVEYCDNKDNNCNGPRVASPLPGPSGSIVPADPTALTTIGTPPGIDDNALCPPGDTCILGVCVPAACGTERPPPEGYTCVNGQVALGTCGGGTACAAGEVCQYGTCIGPCDGVSCGAPSVCAGGACIAGGCYETGCGAGQLCLNGACVADPCQGVSCPNGTFCRQGDCVQACTFVGCAVGQKCGIDGFCVADPCAGHTCGAGEQCVNGACAADPCATVACPTGQVCDSSSGAAACVDDPCTGVVCPAGVCIRGQCYATGNPTGAGAAATTSSKTGGGCGCGSGGGAAFPALLALLAAPLARRRRGPAGAAPAGGRAGILLALVSVVLLASACKSSKTQSQVDTSGCAATCGEQRCVDVNTDPANCGQCSFACSAGQQCVDGACGPTTLVAPFIQSVSPSTAPKDDASVTLTLSGQRFAAGATVRIVVGPPLAPIQKLSEACPSTPGGACWLESAGTIQLTVDLTGIAAGTPYTLRVVNPDHVISNAVSLGVVLPLPAIAGVTPGTVVAGTSVQLDVSPTGSPGTGFTAGSQCHLQGSVIGDVGLPTTLAAAPSNDLLCQLDTSAASGIPPGSYQLTVAQEGNPSVRSNAVTVTVSPSDPVVFAVTPDAASVSSTVSLSVTGARFDTSSRILFDGVAITSTQFQDSGHLFVGAYQVPGTAGLYAVAVQNGAGTPSNAVNFTVGSVTQPSVASFSPPTAYQGDPAVALAFTGSGLPSGSVIEYQPPGTTAFTALASTTSGCGGSPVTCTGVATTGTGLTLVGGADGTWRVRVRLGAPGSPTLSPWPLQVLSNQAILRSYTATPAPAGSGMVGDTKTGFSFSVSNLQGWTAAGTPDLSGVRVAFFDPAFPGTIIHLLTPSPVPSPGATTITTPGFTLSGKAGLYAFTVNNPNATASNALTFTVNPGPPTLSTICLAGTSCTSQVAQSSTPATVTLTGTNFAAPDQYGNNGSVVMVASAYSPNFAQLDPCNQTTVGTTFQQVVGTITVQSPTQMNLTFDTRQAYVDPSGATTYYVSVWNPSSTGGGTPLKSECAGLAPSASVDPRTLPWFKITQ